MSPSTNTKHEESNVDVLIVGAGPAGLMCATWMARMGINARIVDKRNSKIFAGQADGLQARTMEIFDSFGFADRAWKESAHMIEICMWSPDENGTIKRVDRIPDNIPGHSRWQQVVVHQGRIERFLMDHMHKYSNGKIQVERGIMPESIEYDESKAEDPDAYPTTVKLVHLSEEDSTPEQAGHGTRDGLFRSVELGTDDTDEVLQRVREKEGMTETVHCKYVVGCDGAHSWVRKQLGYRLEGDASDHIWGVLDVIPFTDFPDIRTRCSVHSAEHGSLMNIPRENKMTRLYIQLSEVHPDEETGRADRSQITPENILAAAQKILHPYKVSYDYCDWWTAYQIGQRVGKQFSKDERIFLAGDAVHTHSPKAGQGMNISMQDCYNLGWKIALCCKGLADRKILKTYQSERRRIAQDLIDFDRKFSRLFSGRPAKDAADEEGVSMEEFKDVFHTSHMFTMGTNVDYGTSVLIAKPGDAKQEGDGTDVGHADSHPVKRVVGKQELAKNIKLGHRFPSYKVLNHSDGRPWHFADMLRSDGRFRLTILAGDMADQDQRKRLNTLAEKLSNPDSGLLHKYTPAKAAINSVIQLLTVHSSPRTAIEIFDFPELLIGPFTREWGWDFDQVFSDSPSYHEGFADAYAGWGVDKKRGAVIISRPDQYVGYIGELEDVDELDRYFATFLNPVGVLAGGKLAEHSIGELDSCAAAGTEGGPYYASLKDTTAKPLNPVTEAVL